MLFFIFYFTVIVLKSIMRAKEAWGYQLRQHSFIDTGLTLQLKHILAICKSYPNCKGLLLFFSRLLPSSQVKWIGKLKCNFTFYASRKKKRVKTIKSISHLHLTGWPLPPGKTWLQHSWKLECWCVYSILSKRSYQILRTKGKWLGRARGEQKVWVADTAGRSLLLPWGQNPYCI